MSSLTQTAPASPPTRAALTQTEHQQRLHALISRTAFDRELRQRMLAAPAETLESHGIPVLNGSTITCVERSADLMLVLPPVLDEPVELAAEELLGVNGGEGSPSAVASAAFTGPASFVCSLILGASIAIASMYVTRETQG